MNPGTKIGAYEILAPIGAGGMGEVYRARDPRLKRDVALKVLPEAFAADPARMARFQREAEVLASLNHPNIAHLYGIEERALVMELVEGESLPCPVPVETEVDYARQIAAALEYAHERGVVHRDLKPANIKVTPEGLVKLLDFGLAKAVEEPGEAASNPANSPTLTMGHTRAGVILGTAAYMAPEQARGKAVDKRADIWAFGVVLYEMLTGRQLFEGEDLTETLAAVVKQDPDLSAAPPRFQRLLRKCLEKDPKKRLRDISSLEFLIESEPPGVAAPRRYGMAGWITAAVFALLAASLAFLHYRQRAPEDQAVFSSIAYPANSTPGFLALSPDARRLVIRTSAPGRQQLLMRSLDSPEIRLLAEGANVRAPFWSPDGRFVGFFADGKLKTIPAAGGPAQELCDVSLEVGGAWSRAGVILFGSGGALDRVNANGGSCQELTKPEAVNPRGDPQFLPDSKHFFYLNFGPDLSKHGVYLASLGEPIGKRVLADVSSVLYAPAPPGGRYSDLLFVRDRVLMAQPFDDSKLQTVGDPISITDEVSRSQDQGVPNASVSATGVLVTVTGKGNLDSSRLVWLDRTGKEVGSAGAVGGNTALSPDGRFVLGASPNSPGRSGVTLLDLARGSSVPIPEAERPAVWAPDSRTIVYPRRRELYRREAAGGAEVLVLHNTGANLRLPSDWSRDGHFVVYTEIDPKSRGDIWYLVDPLTRPAKPVAFLATDADESQAQLSPDGRWVAYFSTESGGQGDIFVRPFPTGRGEWKVSAKGGTDPRWSPDGKEIYFLLAGGGFRSFWSATFGAGRDGTPEIGVPQKLFDSPGGLSTRDANEFVYSPAPGRFLVSAWAEAPSSVINLMTNWRKLARAR